MMKNTKLLSFILVLALLTPTTFPTASFSATFSDTKGHWAESFIDKAERSGVVQGYPDGTFRPNRPVTRAEFVTMINKILQNTATASINFYDVPQGAWYYQDIARGVAAAYITGYGSNSFQPDNNITRQEAAVIISRIVPTHGSTGNLFSYNDSSLIPEWAYAAFQKANGKGYLGPYNDGKLHPTDQLTRAQAAKILCEITEREKVITTSTILRTNTTLNGAIYSNGLTIHSDLGSGSVSIDNCIVLGTLEVNGGGGNSVRISNSRVTKVNVSRPDSSVRLEVSGETVIGDMTASRTAVIQTNGLTGGLYGSGIAALTTLSSSNIILRGSFPRVTVNGSSARLNLESGSITNLDISSAARNSEITVGSSASIYTANVSAESSFKGTGNISNMNVYANNVTYEKRPANLYIGPGLDGSEETDAYVTFDPKDGAKNVSLNKTITITFASAMKLYDGGTIHDDDVPDFVSLREKSSSGYEVPVTATINSAKKVVTIRPEDGLEKDTTYFIVIPRNELKDSDGNGNKAYTVSFSTGNSLTEGDGDDDIIFDPDNEDTGVSRGVEPTIEFPMAVITYDGQIVTRDYLQEAIVLREGSSTSRRVPFTADINFLRDTITVTPKNDLVDEQEYYFGIASRKFRYRSSNDEIKSKYVYFTVGRTVVAPTVTEIRFSSVSTNSLTVSAVPNYSGTLYALLKKSGEAPPGVQTLKNEGTRASVTKGNSRSFTFNNRDVNTEYICYFLLNAKSKDSAVIASAPQKTNSAAVTPAPIGGVISPEAGKTPSSAISDGTGFAAAISWNGDPSEFDFATRYTARITLTAASGYVFSANLNNTAAISGFTVNGNRPSAWVSNDGSTLVFEVQFPATEGVPSPTVILGPGSAGVAGNGTITGLTPGEYYKVESAGSAFFVTQNGVLSSELKNIGRLTGEAITGLTNLTTYTVTAAAKFNKAPSLTFWDHPEPERRPGTTGSAIVLSSGVLPLNASPAGILYGINIGSLVAPDDTFELMRITIEPNFTTPWTDTRCSGVYLHPADMFTSDITGKEVGIYKYKANGSPEWINGMSIIYAPTVESLTDYLFLKHSAAGAGELTLLTVRVGNAQPAISPFQPLSTGEQIIELERAVSATPMIARGVVTLPAADKTFEPLSPASAVFNLADKAVTINLANGAQQTAFKGTVAYGQEALISGANSGSVKKAGTATAPSFTVDTTAISKNGGAMSFNIVIREKGKSDITYKVSVNVASPKNSAIFGLIHPTTGDIATVNRVVTVNVAKDTKIVVIKGGLSPGQSAVVNKVGVYFKPDETDKTKSAFTVTVNTIDAAGGKVEFPITVKEPGKADIVYTVTINLVK